MKKEIEHVELDCPKILDAITFLIQFGPLKREYPNEAAFKEDIRATIQNYLEKNRLNETVRLLADSQGQSLVAPAAIFGVDFYPDIVLEENGEPLVAILVKLVRSNPAGLVQAAGRALIFSHQYPWVLSLVLDLGKRRREKRDIDHEFRADMWHNRQVRFLFR